MLGFPSFLHLKDYSAAFIALRQHLFVPAWQLWIDGVAHPQHRRMAYEVTRIRAEYFPEATTCFFTGSKIWRLCNHLSDLAVDKAEQLQGADSISFLDLHLIQQPPRPLSLHLPVGFSHSIERFRAIFLSSYPGKGHAVIWLAMMTRHSRPPSYSPRTTIRCASAAYDGMGMILKLECSYLPQGWCIIEGKEAGFIPFHKRWYAPFVSTGHR